MSERENDGAKRAAKKTYYLVTAAYFDDGHVCAYVSESQRERKPQNTSRRSEDMKADIYEEWFYTEEEAKASAKEWENSMCVPQEV
jgi:hypothetical protein